MSDERFDKAIEEIENALEDIKEMHERTIPEHAQDALWYAKNGVVGAVRVYLAARSSLTVSVQIGNAPSEKDLAAIRQAEFDMSYFLKQVDELETPTRPHTSVAPASSAQDADAGASSCVPAAL